MIMDSIRVQGHINKHLCGFVKMTLIVRSAKRTRDPPTDHIPSSCYEIHIALNALLLSPSSELERLCCQDTLLFHNLHKHPHNA
jgi:hypothetical protein